MKRLKLALLVALTSVSTALFAQPRAEYPRPQFERSEWLNLNGEWNFELDLSNSGYSRKLYKSTTLPSKIVVTFAVVIE